MNGTIGPLDILDTYQYDAVSPGDEKNEDNMNMDVIVDEKLVGETGHIQEALTKGVTGSESSCNSST